MIRGVSYVRSLAVQVSERIAAIGVMELLLRRLRPTSPHALMTSNRSRIHAPGSVGDRVADRVVAAIGSWRFVITQSILTLTWILLNVLQATHVLHFDPYPFILLNLTYSFQAGFTGPILLLASNRQSAIDRKRDDHEAEEVDQLYQINKQQLEILQLLRELKDAQ